MQSHKLLMMITILSTVLISGVSMGFCADVAKIGTINFEKIFNNSAAGKNVKNQINKQGRGMNADLEKFQKDIKALQEELKKDAETGVLNDTARETKQWELNRKIDEVKALKKRFDRKIQTLQVKLINGVKKDVLKIVSDYSKKEGYLLIMEDINIVYAPKTLDITDKIIQLYDASYSKK